MGQQALVFTLGETKYCVGIDRVNEIVEKGDLTQVPNTASHVEGVMDLRGETTTIIDPNNVLNTGVETTGDRVIIFESEDQKRPVGWLVDRVHAVIEVSDDDIEPVSDETTVRGVIRSDERFVIWVRPAAVNPDTRHPEPAV